MMKRTDFIPDPTPKGKCDKHGEYEFKYIQFNDEYMVADYCVTCVDEKNKSEEEKRIKEEKEEKIKAKETRRRNNRLYSGISERNIYKTFDDYICQNEGQSKAKNDCIRYVKEFPCDKSLIMSGSVGTGKTLLASAILDSLVDDHSCYMIKVAEIIRTIKSTWRKDSDKDEQDAIDFFVHKDLLIIDEVGVRA